MYFKQLDLAGFKSFADRTVVRLEPGMTGIVGPNGCGKSNILDALRWALGEQRAKTLRGSHMLDVIFNGSENRQPMGMSEVSVTFDNSDSRLPVDFSEVQVTRRLYRSGESEYLLNRTPCRLRDIQELFMDTGIGTNAYSLIGQGQISMVLSSKPEDRRFLFEEAAGIIKYKSRKRVAIRKLDGAEQNLLRLGDIIAEVQRQMRSLKRQVNAAIRYREMKEQLQDLEIRAIYTKYAALRAELAGLRSQFAKAQDAYEKAMAENSRFEARNEELALNRIEVERILEARRDDVAEIDSEMEKIERQIALLRQQIQFLKEQQEQARQEHEAHLRRAEEIEAQIGRTGEATQAVRQEIEQGNAAIEAKQAEVSEAQEHVAATEERLEAIRARVVASMNDRARTQTELETLAATIQNADGQLESIYARQETQHQRNEELTGELEAARESESERLTALEQIVEERNLAAASHKEKTEQLRTLSDEWQSVRERKSSQEARLTSLRELRDSYEGFATGVRAVMAAKRENVPEVRGVIGPIGDLLSADKAHECAIEAALGGSVNNIVVEQAESAKSAIALLKRQRAGRVTFLPLDTIRVGRRDETHEIRGERGVIGRAIDYVTYDAHIEKAVEHILYNTAIVETLDDAIRIARTARRFPRMVTLEGEYVAPSGAVTGGQTKSRGRGLLGRSAEIAELEERVAEAEALIKDLAGRGETLTKEIEELAQRVNDLEGRERTCRAELNELGVAIARSSTELDNLTRALQQMKEEVESIEAKRKSLEEQRAQALTRADSMDNDDAELQREQAAAQDAAAQARQALSARGSELADLRVARAELTQRVEESERNLVREQREREEALRTAEQRTQQAAQFKENEGGLNEEIAAHIERAKALSETKDEAHEKVVEAQNSQQELSRESEGLTKSLRESNDQARAAQAEVHQLEIRLRHDEDQVEFLEERVQTEYHVALGSLDAEKVGEDDHDDATRERMVADLRTRLERMGTVNMMAIEEYEALEQRNDFLVAQDEDLRKARETLLGIVARIDVTIREMFIETFEAVADNFRVFFRRLFSGGQARIYLLDESDPLESGIEIEARPPGKKPQSISLLSGGEAAMTAIALLFAIFKAKPSPFCVLDEVDAPLDDANIGRFLDLVEEFKSESQFIIITHNKQTMAKASVLYGVTMQEPGVSQMVSVRFDEAPERDQEPAA
ncbi:MAG: chromosome segregation protein SMC [Nitrospiraceae bacterium]|nr:chromosome segregation protein SMC [Nitrospiraceae bacterium]